jgi:hypothetical protein
MFFKIPKKFSAAGREPQLKNKVDFASLFRQKGKLVKTSQNFTF